MIPTTRLLASVSVVSAVVCRNVHIGTFHQEFKIIHMTDIPLRNLLLRKLRKSSSAPDALYSTSVDFADSMSNSDVRQDLKRMVIKPFVNTCNAQNHRATDTCDITEHLTKIHVHDDSMKTIADDDSDLMMGRNKDHKLFMTKEKYKTIRKWRSCTTVMSPVNPETHFVVRILSYNILAQILLDNHFYLYREHNDQALYWEKRKMLLQQEILKAKANVICLQEMQVDHVEEFVAAFKAAGYEYLYKKRTNDKQDGLLLLYKSDQLQLVDHAKVELYQSGVELLNRDNVALVAKFSLVESPTTHIVISTTHLLYNPKRDDVRLAQTQLLFAEIERIAFMEFTKDGPRYHPIILSGDFNLQPHTGVYRFITEGSFDYKGKGRTLEPALIRGLGNSLIPPCLLVTDNCQHFNVLTKRLRGEGEGITMIDNIDEEKYRADLLTKSKSTGNMRDEVNTRTTEYQKVKIVEGQYAKFSSGAVTHPLNLYSVYQHTNIYGEAEATTHQDKWITVDYIFFNGVELIDRYNLLTVNECKKLPTIPNTVVGSDHLCLGATFKLKKTKR